MGGTLKEVGDTLNDTSQFLNLEMISKLTIAILGLHVTSEIDWGSTPNRYTVIRLKKIFTVSVDLVFGSKYVQFLEICLLQCSTITNTFWVDPHSELLKKVPVKPKNRLNFEPSK